MTKKLENGKDNQYEKPVIKPLDTTGPTTDTCGAGVLVTKSCISGLIVKN